MRILPSLHRRLLLAGFVAVVTAGCAGSSPSAPSGGAGATAHALPGAVSTETRSGAQLAACMSRAGEAGCFGASRISRSSVAASPFTSAPILNNNNPVMTSGTTVVVSWTAAAGGVATSYIIEVASLPGGPADLANVDLGSPQTNLVVPDVPTGIYYLRIRALDAGGASAPSNEVQLLVGAVVGSCPSQPRNLVNVSQTAGTISLGWQPPASGLATSYVIQVGSAPGRADLANVDTGSPAVTLVAPNVPPGAYYVRVYARNTSCSGPTFLGPASNEVLVFVVGFSGDVQVSVSWDAPSDVDLHVVEPSGEEIYWAHRNSATAGQLDVDSNPACSIDGRQIENIRWGSGAPGGTYTVRVDYYAGCNVPQTRYLVTVKNGASTQTFPGSFTGDGDRGSAGSGILVATFVHAASSVAAGILDLVKAPDHYTPSAEKLRLSGQAIR